MSTVNYGTKALCMVWVSWRYAHECSLKLMSAFGAMRPCSWVLMVAYERSWMLKAIMSVAPLRQKHSWALMRAHGHSWALMSPYKQQWALMIMAPWHKQPSWALISIHEHGAIAPIPLMGTLESPLVSMSVWFLDSVINKKNVNF